MHAGRSRSRAGQVAFGRYLVWQLPGWVVVTLLALGVTRLLELPAWVAAIAAGLVVVKDLALFPTMRVVFRPPDDPRCVGARGQAVDALTPTGLVRVRGELWQATTRDGGRLGARTAIRVVDARGLLLVVEADEEVAQSPSG
jgi:membrane protein implicated in regulation of membrane protease activity